MGRGAHNAKGVRPPTAPRNHNNPTKCATAQLPSVAGHRDREFPQCLHEVFFFKYIFLSFFLIKSFKKNLSKSLQANIAKVGTSQKNHDISYCLLNTAD